MRNSASVQEIHVLEVDNWPQGRAELRDLEPEELCLGQSVHHCGDELHDVQAEELCLDQNVHHCHDELPLSVGLYAGYQNGYSLEKFDQF